MRWPASAASFPELPPRTPSLGSARARPGILLVIALLGVWSFWQLELHPRDLVVSGPNFQLAKEFFARAITPALDYEGSNLPAGLPPLPLRALAAAFDTVIFAAAAMSLAVPVAFVLGFLASTAWWTEDLPGGSSRPRRAANRFLRPAIYGTTRLAITVMRSIHELLWAVLLLAGFGLVNVNAVIALAIPFAGVLAKIFSEIIDETSRDAARALRGAGASGTAVFLFALVPRAFPDMAAYTFYRFECALRSSAVLGFFGFPTLGFFIAASFENLYYGEVWTYLYALFLLIIVVEWWSGRVRRWLV